MILKDMIKEIEKHKDRIYLINTAGNLIKIKLNSLSDYNHLKCHLHHYIPYSEYERNKDWYEKRGIKQKLILMSIPLHEQLHNQAIKNLSDEEFEKKYKISKWELVFNKKHNRY